DVPLALMTAPPGGDPLPARILTLMANGAPPLIASLCLIMTVASLNSPGGSGATDPSAGRDRMNHIELDRVSKTFGERIALDDLSLQIQKAERLVLFGPSGCGKTTVLRLVAGLEVPDQGEIRIADRIVAGSGRNLVPPEKRNVGMVFQDLALWPHM